MADPLKAYEWLHTELASISGQVTEIMRRFKYEARDPAVRQHERVTLIEQLDQISYGIEDLLHQSREEAYELYERVKKPTRPKRKGVKK